MDCPIRLGYDTKIKVTTAAEAVGHLMLAKA
jgi:hypothetical protein